MDCTEFRAAYSDFADGLLDEIQEIAAHRHMSECPQCRRFHEALQWGVAELRKQPRVLPSDDFQERLERRIRAEASGFAPLARSWPGAAAAMLMSLTLLAAGTLGWEVARGGPGRHEAAAEAVPPMMTGIYAPHVIRAQHRPAAKAGTRAEAISFDTLGLTDQARGGEFAAAWSGQ